MRLFQCDVTSVLSNFVCPALLPTGAAGQSGPLVDPIRVKMRPNDGASEAVLKHWAEGD